MKYADRRSCAGTLHPDTEAVAASPDSLLDPSADMDSEPAPHYVERGWPWPPRFAAESFFSYGAFGDRDRPESTARLAGVVLKADRRNTAQAGQVIAGTVFLTGSLPEIEQRARPRRWRR